MKVLGLRFDVITKEEIQYILLYDIDIEAITPQQESEIDIIMQVHQCSYLLYKTKNGYHIIGLTPLNIFQHASIFSALKRTFNSYYGGVVIRLSRKPKEQQQLIKIVESYGEVIPNLFNVFASRFGLEKKPWQKETAKYLLVFEKYRTEKV